MSKMNLAQQNSLEELRLKCESDGKPAEYHLELINRFYRDYKIKYPDNKIECEEISV